MGPIIRSELRQWPAKSFSERRCKPSLRSPLLRKVIEITRSIQLAIGAQKFGVSQLSWLTNEVQRRHLQPDVASSRVILRHIGPKPLCVVLVQLKWPQRREPLRYLRSSRFPPLLLLRLLKLNGRHVAVKLDPMRCASGIRNWERRNNHLVIRAMRSLGPISSIVTSNETNTLKL